MADSNGGYGALPNSIPDLYMPAVSDVQYKVLSCIARKTLGWHKIWDAIPLSQFEEMSGCSRPAIVEAIKGLVKAKAILCGKGQGRSASEYMLNPGYDSFELAVNHFNQLSKLTSKADLLLVVKQINYYAAVVVNEVNTQKKGLKPIKNNDHDQDTLKVSTKQEGPKTDAAIIDDLDSGKEKQNGTLGNSETEYRGQTPVDEKCKNIPEHSDRTEMAVSDHATSEEGRRRSRTEDDTANSARHDKSIEEHDRAAPTKNSHNKRSTPKQSGHNGELPNGMTVQDFYELIEFKIGVVKRGVHEHQGMCDYLSTVPEDRIKTVVEHAIAENTAPRFGLSYIYEHCDQWDYWQKKWMLEPGAREDAELALMRTELADYKVKHEKGEGDWSTHIEALEKGITKAEGR
jgi:phage replication O-like protein O